MKKRIFAALLAAITGGILFTTACSFSDLTEEPKVLNEEDDDDDDDSKKETDIVTDDNGEKENTEEFVEMSTAEQIELISTNKDVWFPYNKGGYNEYAAIMDLDCDNRLEVVVCETVAAAATSVNFWIYEVNDSATGLNEIEIEWKYNESMPDIVMTGITKCAVSGKTQETVEGYVIEDSLMYGYDAYTDRKFVMTFIDNKVSIEKLAYAEVSYKGDGYTETYYGRADNIISKESYESAEDTYLNSKISGSYSYVYQTWEFISMIGDVKTGELAASYDGFRRYSNIDEYYGFSDNVDLYPEGWVPDNYSGEVRYSVLGELEFNEIPGDLDQHEWTAVEVHDSNNIYLYDYSDDISRFDSCGISFGYDGKGGYSDGYGNYTRFTYETYSTELFTNIALYFEDGSYAYAFSYRLYNEASLLDINCLIISFENEEIYFVKAV